MRFRNSSITLVRTIVTAAKSLDWRGFSRMRQENLGHGYHASSHDWVFYRDR
jgi:hypothetical protein